MDVKRFESAAPEISEFLTALANPARLKILCALSQGERNVAELCAVLDAPQPRVSQHLALLRKSGFVAFRRSGRAVHYALADARIAGVMAELTASFCAASEA